MYNMDLIYFDINKFIVDMHNFDILSVVCAVNVVFNVCSTLCISFMNKVAFDSKIQMIYLINMIFLLKIIYQIVKLFTVFIPV